MPNGPTPSVIWPAVPVELARFAASPGGHAMILDAGARGALLRPHVQVSVRNGRFVAEVNFHEPIGPERQDGLAFPLQPFPWENR